MTKVLVERELLERVVHVMDECIGFSSTANELRAMIAQPSHDVASVPDGFVMVPVEPTPEMLDCIMDWQKIGNVTAYRAMLAAAPKAGTPALTNLSA